AFFRGLGVLTERNFPFDGSPIQVIGDDGRPWWTNHERLIGIQAPARVVTIAGSIDPLRIGGPAKLAVSRACRWTEFEAARSSSGSHDRRTPRGGGSRVARVSEKTQNRLQRCVVQVGECGHFRPAAQDDLTEVVKAESRAGAGERGRPRSGPDAFDPVAGLATLLVGRLTGVAICAPAAIRMYRERIIEAQFVNG